MSSIQVIRCPTCGIEFRADVKSKHMPFCSPNCQLIDLNRWMNHEIGLPHYTDEEEGEQVQEIEIRREWKFDEDESSIE